jgi:hypothetical protein
VGLEERRHRLSEAGEQGPAVDQPRARTVRLAPARPPGAEHLVGHAEHLGNVGHQGQVCQHQRRHARHPLDAEFVGDVVEEAHRILQPRRPDVGKEPAHERRQPLHLRHRRLDRGGGKPALEHRRHVRAAVRSGQRNAGEPAGQVGGEGEADHHHAGAGMAEEGVLGGNAGADFVGWLQSRARPAQGHDTAHVGRASCRIHLRVQEGIRHPGFVEHARVGPAVSRHGDAHAARLKRPGDREHARGFGEEAAVGEQRDHSCLRMAGSARR